MLMKDILIAGRFVAPIRMNITCEGRCTMLSGRSRRIRTIIRRQIRRKCQNMSLCSMMMTMMRMRKEARKTMEEKEKKDQVKVLQAERTLSADYEILNLTKILDYIASAKPNPITKDTVNHGRIHVFSKRDITTDIYLTLEEHAVQLSIDLTSFDRVVFEAVCTLWDQSLAPQPVLTLEQITRRVFSNDNGKLSQQQLDRVEASVDKMTVVRADLNCTAELYARRKIKEGEEAFLHGYLLPLEKYTYKKDNIELVSGNNKVVYVGYRVITQPIVYVYAKTIGQVATVPSALFRGGDVSNTAEAVVLRRYIIERSVKMRNPHNPMGSYCITYQYWADENGENVLKGLLPKLGYSSDKYKNDKQWDKKRLKIHSDVCAILKSLVKQHFIAGYEIEYDKKKTPGRRKVNGVRIVLTDADMAEINKAKERRKKAAERKTRKSKENNEEAHT